MCAHTHACTHTQRDKKNTGIHSNTKPTLCAECPNVVTMSDCFNVPNKNKIFVFILWPLHVDFCGFHLKR